MVRTSRVVGLSSLRFVLCRFSCRLDLLLVLVPSETFLNTDKLRLNIVAIENAHLRPDIAGDELPYRLLRRKDSGKDDVGYDMVAVGVPLTGIRQDCGVSREDAEVVDLGQTVLGLLVVRRESTGHLLNMRPKVLVILNLGLGLDVLQLGTHGPGPLGFGILLCVFDAVGTVRGVLVLGEGGDGGVHLAVDTVDIRLDLFDLGSDVGLVVRIHIGCGVGSSLQIGFAHARRRLG
jgi:hypothetical protein